MKTTYSTISRTFFILNLFIIALFMPTESQAYSSHRYGYSGHSHHFGHSSYRHRGHSSRHYKYRKYRRYRRPYFSYKRYPRRYKSYSYSYPAYRRSNYSSVNHYASPLQTWDTLYEGHDKKALSQFSIEAQQHPESGLPKVGYALASAAGGDLEKGIWAMRRAFKIDPNALASFYLNKKSHVLLNQLIFQYAQASYSLTSHHNFMIAALHYLKQDYPAAKKALSQYNNAAELESTSNLKALLANYDA